MIPGAPESEIREILGIINKHLPRAKVCAFGSRAAGNHKPSSDLDICVDAGRKITLEESALIKRALDETDLPYRVDIIDRAAVDAKFLEIIKKTEVILG
ncbi:MAG TPA: nucleotidyltransferase domain-containing protein [bacterium]|nr:nucleotidyltransferase domain-containing protein [bacterium]